MLMKPKKLKQIKELIKPVKVERTLSSEVKIQELDSYYLYKNIFL